MHQGPPSLRLLARKSLAAHERLLAPCRDGRFFLWQIKLFEALLILTANIISNSGIG
jgi:hypothetical protein